MSSPNRGAGALLAILAVTLSGSHGQQAINVGELLTRLVTPDRELMGGLAQVIDRSHEFDGIHLNCAQRAICHGMSATAVLRRDGTTVVEKGVLRQVVDTVGDVLFDMARPFLDLAGMGAVAREEVSFTTFLIDMVDSAIISITRVLAGRRVSRQFEEFSPLLTFVDPALKVVNAIPKAYIGNIVDFMVDVTNVADRRRGLYSAVRAGGLGYAYGSDENSNICASLDADGDGMCDDGDGGFFPLASLNQINDHQLGKVFRGADTNPLMKRGHIGDDVMQYNAFEFGDLFNPKSLLCKVDNVMRSTQKHAAVVSPEGEGEPDYYLLDAVDLEMQKQNLDEAYDHEAEDFGDDDYSEKSTDSLTKSTEDMAVRVSLRVQQELEDAKRSDNERAVVRPETDMDHFNNYCRSLNMVAKRKYMKMKNADLETAVTETEDEIEEEDDEPLDYDEDQTEAPEDGTGEDVLINVRDSKKKENEPAINDLEQLARLGDRSLLVDRLEVEQGEEQEVMKTFVSSLEVDAEGAVEKVIVIQGNKGKTLLVQFDSVTYRDAVLKASRSPEARSASKTKLRKPKVKDLKHVESLRH